MVTLDSLVAFEVVTVNALYKLLTYVPGKEWFNFLKIVCLLVYHEAFLHTESLNLFTQMHSTKCANLSLLMFSIKIIAVNITNGTYNNKR